MRTSRRLQLPSPGALGSMPPVRARCCLFAPPATVWPHQCMISLEPVHYRLAVDAHSVPLGLGGQKPAEHHVSEQACGEPACDTLAPSYAPLTPRLCLLRGAEAPSACRPRHGADSSKCQQRWANPPAIRRAQSLHRLAWLQHLIDGESCRLLQVSAGLYCLTQHPDLSDSSSMPRQLDSQSIELRISQRQTALKFLRTRSPSIAAGDSLS